MPEGVKVIALAILVVVLVFGVAALWSRHLAAAREAHIRSFHFPNGLFSKVIAKYPHLTHKDMALVSRGLRQFFLAHLKSGRQYVSMPSQVADELWHEFILHTRSYEAFTRRSFGTFLHHTPAVTLNSQSQSNIGLRRCWKYACLEENINPRKPSRLPLLFGLDAKLGIANGFHYVSDCSGVRRQTAQEGGAGSDVHCGGDFSDRSFDGSLDGLMDSGGHGTPGSSLDAWSDAGGQGHHGHGSWGDGGGDAGGDAGGDGGGGSCGGGGCGGD
jgi:hypothetical protein